nr:MAG TPA: hypothetical protein [Caudoviricetes sp.]
MYISGHSAQFKPIELTARLFSRAAKQFGNVSRFRLQAITAVSLFGLLNISRRPKQ